MKKTKKENPFTKDYLVSIDYGNNAKHCYLFLKSTKVQIMDFLSKRGIGEAAKNIDFIEVGKTKYENIFWFVLSVKDDAE